MAQELTKKERMAIPQIVAIGGRLAFHEDLYHFILRLTWMQFFGIMTLVFVLVNVVFAMLYMAVPNSVQNASGFFDHFFFSVETLATIGYGEMVPQGRWGHAIMSVQALGGILTTALVTGLTFARFARPTARILFTDKMVIAPRDGVPHLQFRMANARRNQISEATVSVLLLLTETTAEGETMRRPSPLKLVRERNQFFALSWMVLHRIDETSPFYGEDALAKLREQKAELFASVAGLDETMMSTITARWRYQLTDIVQNARFADVLTLQPDGSRVIDYNKFNDLMPL